MTTSSSQVAVFWDFENCRPSCNTSGSKVIDKIRCLVQGFGSITTFRAYIDLTLECVNPRSTSLHSDLQSSGLTLVHCPHNGKKDVADKMMIVDMLASAIDRPPPASIVIITGDRDFAYAAAVLKLRGYRIIVIAPPHIAHSSLKVQADQLYDWQKDVLGGTDPEIIPTIPTPLKPIALAGLASQEDEVLPPTHVTPPTSQPKGSPVATPPINSLGRYDVIPAPLNEPATRVLSDYRLNSGPLPPSSSDQKPVFLGPDHGESELQPVAEGPVDSPSISISPGKLTLVDELSASPRLNMEVVRSRETFKQPQVRIATEPHHVSSPRNKSSGTPTTFIDSETSSLLSGTDIDGLILSIGESLPSEPDYSSSYNLLSPSSSGPDREIPPSILDSPYVQVELDSDECGGSAESNIPSTLGPSGNGAEVSIEQADAPPCLLANVDRHHSCPVALPKDSCPSIAASSQKASPASIAHAPEIESTASPEASSTDTLASTLSPSFPTPVSRQRFETLIAFFIERRASKKATRIYSSEVASEILKRDSQVYKKAGVTRLKPFIEEARKAGIIISPGMDNEGNTWVEINPTLYPMDDASQAAENPVSSTSSSKGFKSSSSSILEVVVEAIFHPLINRLRTEIPSHRLLYSTLGTFLRKQHPDYYKRASVSGLSTYLQKAEKQGIVRLGCTVTQGSEWVELMPAHRSSLFQGWGYS